MSRSKINSFDHCMLQFRCHCLADVRICLSCSSLISFEQWLTFTDTLVSPSLHWGQSSIHSTFSAISVVMQVSAGSVVQWCAGGGSCCDEEGRGGQGSEGSGRCKEVRGCSAQTTDIWPPQSAASLPSSGRRSPSLGSHSPSVGCQLSEFASSCSSEQRYGSSPASSPSSHHLRSSEKRQMWTILMCEQWHKQ